MKKLTREDLWSLEDYAGRRDEFRREVMAHKQKRRLAIGPHLTLYFEDRLTIRYQVQEMLRAEKIFEAAGIQDELDAYNPLVPDGCNLKATMMIEFGDVPERRSALAELGGIEHKVWIGAADGRCCFAVADEDLKRSDPKRTSAVHFLRFELDEAGVRAIKSGGDLAAGVDHPHYTHRVDRLPRALLRSLAQDLD